MRAVAFFRNLNLGRPHCPTRTQFEAAFVDAGAVSAVSFLVNGTMVFEVPAGGRARPLLARACTLLRAHCGLQEPAFLRTMTQLAALVRLDPFARVAPGDVYACCASFLPDADIALAPLPLESARGDVRVLHCTGSEALSVSLMVGRSPGSPNAFLERLLGRPTTTRSWNTVRRLVQHCGSEAPR